MEDLNLIAMLIPHHDYELAKKAFHLLHNSAQYLLPTKGITETPIISSREAIPAWQGPIEVNYNSFYHIQLTFSLRLEAI